MKQAVEMPQVMRCSVEECVYNRESMCHARGITVGDRRQHLCDTMAESNQHTRRQGFAGVGACRSVNCAYNEDWECQAEGIDVTLSGDSAICGTFSAR